MVIRQTPKDKHKYVIINNSKMIYELSELGIFPKYMDNINLYFAKSDKLSKYFKEKDFEEWWN